MAQSKSSKTTTKTQKKAPRRPLGSGAAGAPRLLKSKERHRSYRSFRLDKKIKPKKRIPKARVLFAQSFRLVKANIKLYVGILALFFVLSFVFVRGFGGGVDIGELESMFNELLDGAGRLWSSAALLAFLASDVNAASSDIGSVYQGILYIIVSLAVIYATRLRIGKKPVTVKRSFYEGMYPVIPFVLVLTVIGLQLLPLLFGSWLFNAAIGNALAINPVEQFGFGAVFFLLAVLSLYMIASSIFALYIVTLPGMTPLRALRSARELVRYRRWEVLRKLLFLPVVLTIIGALMLFPGVLLLTGVAEFLVLAYSLFAIVFAHVYVYTMYRALL